MCRQLTAVGGSAWCVRYPWLQYACAAGLGEVYSVRQCLVVYVIINAPAPGAAAETSPAAALAATSEAAAPQRPQSAAATATTAAAIIGPPPAPGALANTFENWYWLRYCSVLRF